MLLPLHTRVAETTSFDSFILLRVKRSEDRPQRSVAISFVGGLHIHVIQRRPEAGGERRRSIVGSVAHESQSRGLIWRVTVDRRHSDAPTEK